MIVCRQLGFDPVGAMAVGYEQGVGPIYIIWCTGSEENIISFSDVNTASYCYHFEDARVICPSS